MKSKDFNSALDQARNAYFEAADDPLEKNRRELGDGPAGLKRLLARKPRTVDNSADNQSDKD